MFATQNFCFLVRRDRTSNAAAHRGERESGSRQSQHDAGVPCGNRGHSLADRQPHRKREISCFCRDLRKIEPSVRSQHQSFARRFAAPESRPHRAHQTRIGTKTETEEIISPATVFDFPSLKFSRINPCILHIALAGNVILFLHRLGGGGRIYCGLHLWLDSPPEFRRRNDAAEIVCKGWKNN